MERMWKWLGWMLAGGLVAGGVVTAHAATAMRPVEPALPETLVSQPPHLRNVLPENALAYLRVPSPWGALATPSGGTFDRAFGSRPYSEAVQALRRALPAVLADEISPETMVLVELLLTHARSPLELALVPPSDPALPMPDLLATLAVDFADGAALNVFLKRLAESSPFFNLIIEMNPEGAAAVSLAGLPALLQFDAVSGRLYLMAGASASPKALAALVGQRPGRFHVMHGQEARIDAGGQGLFGWISPPAVLEFLALSGQADQMVQLQAFGAADMAAVAFGVGTVDGKSRIRAVVEMPRTGFRAFVPLAGQQIEFAAAGEPNWLLLLSLPDGAAIAELEGLVAGIAPPESMAQYHAAKRELADKLGYTVEAMADAIGPEMLVLSDAAGQYAALRLRDRERFRQLVGQLAKRDGYRLEKRNVAGRDYFHLATPALFEPREPDEGDRGDASQAGFGSWLIGRLATLPGHFFWTEEGDYLVLADLPQVLIDRSYVTERVPLATWLAEQQALDASGSWLLGTVRTEGIPQMMYQFQLQLLLALADLVGSPLDIFALPTAREAGVSAVGAYSFSIDSTDRELALELSYEHNPLEILAAGGGGATALALVGITAAIAIPAYSDYQVRGQLVGGIELTAGVREATAILYLRENRLPTQVEVDALVGALPDYVESVTIDPDNGVITITFAIDALGDERHVYLGPQVDEGEISWSCSSDISNKHLPEFCRTQP